MTDDSLDKVFRDKAREMENTPLPHWPSTHTLWNTLCAKRNRVKQRRRLAWRVAAAMLILAVAGYGYFSHSFQQESLTESNNLSPMEQNAVDFIARYCADKNIACTTPEMLQLRQDLEQSFRKLEEVGLQLQVYGNDPELIRAKERIESHQARLIKTIVQTL